MFYRNLLLITVALWGFCASVAAQAVKRDTVYIYETVIVYDTLVIHDTIRINKALTTPALTPAGDSAIFFDAPAATFSENGIILHENNHQKKIKTMKLKTSNYLAALIIAAQSWAGLSAQETPPDDLPAFPMQMSIVYPMTTQGAKTADYRYNFSFNLFSGKIGALTGFEFGSFFNRVERDATGVQLSGLFNVAHRVRGMQFGGLGNAAKEVNGMQLGGLGNISGHVTGFQFGGLANISESVRGMQLAGITNISRDVKGFQFGGIVNLNESNKGGQFSGIANVTDASAGFQFAGVANVSGEVSGASFGSLFNRTGKLKGFQFGIVNVVDTVESGVSMAIVNIVRKGFYREWALTFADYLNVGLSYKMGIQRFYTIYTIGANFAEDKLWVAGIGFGNRTPLGPKIDFQPEIVAYNYYPSDFKDVQGAWATHLKLGFVYKLNDRLGISVAPSIYQYNADMDDNSEYYKISPISLLYKHKSGKSLDSVGFGISVGLIFR